MTRVREAPGKPLLLKDILRTDDRPTDEEQFSARAHVEVRI